MTGTSMAAPMVAGAAALLRSVDPTADYLDIKDFILSTLDPMPSLEAMGRELVNNGRLNLARAVLAANGVNDPPVADDLELLFQVGEQQIAGVVSARDPESSNLTYSLWDHPRYGSLTFLSNGEFTYEPDPTFTSGYDRFTFIANDGELNSAPATVTLAVNEIGLDWHEGYIRACIDNDELGDFDFAAAVAVGADLLVVGSPGTSTLESAGINPSDHVRTFMRTADDTWIYSGSLNLAGGPNNNIGYSVAIEEYVTGDSTIVVGAPNTAMNTENDSRSIFIYDKEPSENWPDVIPSTITPLDQDADAFNLFGCSVAIDGDTIVVGAANDGNGTGAVYVFEKQPTGWDSSAYTKFTGGLQDVGFGCSVAICGDTIIIGSMGSVSDPGSAYIIEKGMGWSANAPRIQLQADTPASGDEFGFSVAIYEATAIVGAPGSSSDRGAAYVFWEDSAWSTLNQGQLLASDGAAGDRFGHAVSTDGGRAVVGAPNRDVAPNLEYVGAGYVYDRAGNDWEDYFSATPLSLHEFQLLGSIGGEEDIFGFAVGISGNTIVAGAPGYFSSPAGTGTRHLGLAYLYEANHLPAVNSITVDCDGSVPVSSRVEAFDFDGDEMTFSTVSGPPNGTLSWLDPNLGTFLYTPGPSHQDGDWFSFRATDGDGYSSVATVTFTPVPQVIAAGVSRTGSGWSADSTQWPGSVLPWAGVNEINVTFDEAIDPTSVSLDKVSVSTAGGSSVSLLSVSVAGSVLTIKLANGISLSGEETYEIEILDSVTDLDGNRLDGEMAAGTFPSGDLISGGAWRYSITTLTGDADGDGYVGADDLDLVRANWGSQVTPGDLSVGDVFPDGVISGDDLDAVRDNWGAGTPPQRGAGGRGGESPIRIETIDNPLDGYITHDLLFAVVENWLSAELKLDLTRGSLYQDRDGGDTTPHPGLLAERSTVVYDTYLSGGSANADVTVFGGAVDLGGSSEFVMTENEIDATWFSTSKTDARLLQLARLTFSGDAVGTWSMRVSDSIGAVHFVSGTILDGRLYI
jgi:hypothetical protein